VSCDIVDQSVRLRSAGRSDKTSRTAVRRKSRSFSLIFQANDGHYSSEIGIHDSDDKHPAVLDTELCTC